MSIDIKNKLWVEKYRPKDTYDFIGDTHIKEQLLSDIEDNTLQNYLFYGPPGTGKTTLAKLYYTTLDCDHVYINASDERGIDTIREKVIRFTKVGSFKPIKIVVLDEADYLTPQAQATLRNTIEEASKNTRFIMTCNHKNKIIDALQSRCIPIEIIPPDRIEIGIRLGGLLSNENVDWEVKDVMKVVDHYYPDQRKMINHLQLITKSGAEKNLEVSSFLSTDTSSIIKLFNGEKSIIKFSSKLRVLLKEEKTLNFDAVYRDLYDRVDDIKGVEFSTLVSLLNDAMYKSSFKVDPEINFCNFMIELKTKTYE